MHSFEAKVKKGAGSILPVEPVANLARDGGSPDLLMRDELIELAAGTAFGDRG